MRLAGIESGGKLLFSREQIALKRIVSRAPLRLDKNANAQKWMTPQYSNAVVVVKISADRAFVVLTLIGFVFKDNLFSAAYRRHRRKKAIGFFSRKILSFFFII